jgi:hypothetical protein
MVTHNAVIYGLRYGYQESREPSSNPIIHGERLSSSPPPLEVRASDQSCTTEGQTTSRLLFYCRLLGGLDGVTQFPEETLPTYIIVWNLRVMFGGRGKIGLGFGWIT